MVLANFTVSGGGLGRCGGAEGPSTPPQDCKVDRCQAKPCLIANSAAGALAGYKRYLRNVVERVRPDHDIDVEAASFVVHRVVFDFSQDYTTGAVTFDQTRAIDALADMIYRFLFKPRPGA